MEYETAGDPMRPVKWTRKTTRKISVQLKKLGLTVSKNTVGRLLAQLKYRLRVNHKKLASGTKTERATRDQQFSIINELREHYMQKGNPVISVDTKKKELIGNFKNPGQSWRKEAASVNDHDFRSDAEAVISPYSILDMIANRGSVYIGQSADTSEFAVDAIERWWKNEGIKRYPRARRILILADSGGSNSYRTRAWKHWLQHKLCSPHKLSVSVSHYPPGASKWNPIEHRLFCHISKNWEGRPLDSFETALKYIRTTRTATGLRVTASRITKTYEKGIKISDDEMEKIKLRPASALPKWNYTIVP